MTTIATLDPPGVSAESRPARAFVYHQVMAMPGDDDANSRAASAYAEGYQYWEHYLRPMNVELHEEQLVDVTTAVRYVPLVERPVGRKLTGMAKANDHVIHAQAPRALVEVKDFLWLISVWRSRTIGIHVAELQLDMTTDAGRVLAEAFRLIVKGQRDVKSRQNLIIAERSRRMGRPTNGSKKVGYRLERRCGVRYWVADMEERGILCEIQRLREQEAKTWEQVSHEIARCLAKDGNPSSFNYWKRQWSRQRCCNRYHAWLRVQEEERAAGLLGDADADEQE